MAEHNTPNGFIPPEDLAAAERVERYISDLHAGQPPIIPADANAAEADAMQMATRLHAAREAAAGPRDAFVSDLRARLERELFPTVAVPPPAAPKVVSAPATRQSRAGTSRRAVLRGGLAAAGGLAAGLAGGTFLGEALAGRGPGDWSVPLVANGTWQTVAQAAKVAPGSVQRFTTDQLVGHLVRYQDGSFAAYSAACTHMGCIVGWNAAQRTFDCPCHNGRFNDHGQFVSGAVTYRPLPAIQTRVLGDEVQVLVPASNAAPEATPTDNPGYGH